MESYQKLAAVYDQDWGKFSLAYLKVIDYIEENYGYEIRSALDIACGTGNLIIEMAKQGIEVVGSDLSPEMIEMARKKDESIEFRVNDMAHLYQTKHHGTIERDVNGIKLNRF